MVDRGIASFGKTPIIQPRITATEAVLSLLDERLCRAPRVHEHADLK